MALRCVYPSRKKTRAASLQAALLLYAAGALIACGDDDKSGPGPAEDAGREDGGAGNKGDGATGGGDAGQGGSEVDGGTSSNGDAGDADGGGSGDGGCTGSSCTSVDPRAPWALNCANLPTNTRCAGGPREVLLAMEETGWIVMLDPADGHFLGYFKRPTTDYTLDNYGEYFHATQGPDQCIWTVSSDEHLLVQRWDTNGGYIDQPLKPHFIEVTGSPPQAAIDEPQSLAFTADRVLVSSTYGYPNPRVTRWTLDGTFDGVVLDDGAQPYFSLAMGDGSLLVADYNNHAVVRYPAGGAKPEKIWSEVQSVPSQLAYLGGGKLLVANGNLGEPLSVVDLDTGVTSPPIYPFPQVSNNFFGAAGLSNGKWLLAGGTTELVSLDPESANPKGQYTQVFDDSAADAVNFKYLGRACLSEAFVASRASKPAVSTCTVPAGTPILSEDFQTGDFSGSGASQAFKGFRARGTAGVTLSLETPSATGSTRALKVAGGTNASRSGVRLTFPSAIKPSYVSYRVLVSSEAPTDSTLAVFMLSNSAVLTAQGVSYYNVLKTYTYNDYLSAGNSGASKPDQLRDKWAHVELRNIDWQNRTFDFYVDCTRYGEALSIPAGYGDDADVLDLYNYVTTASANNVAWYDDIVIQ